TLEEMATAKDDVGKLARAWKAGDAAAIEEAVLSDLKSEPEMYRRLLVDRNRNWLPKLEALFARPRPAFVIVGAAHLVGADGLLAMLRAKGYTVTQL
ncbi:MAG TPA: TraB/GumN family protein, partial [Vicinamibacterales bacterium]|nr:TraB/GumN family protein [Vicinamibacterales bacterium]